MISRASPWSPCSALNKSLFLHKRSQYLWYYWYVRFNIKGKRFTKWKLYTIMCYFPLVGFLIVKNQYNTSKVDGYLCATWHKPSTWVNYWKKMSGPKNIQNGRQEIQNSRHKYSFSQSVPQKLTNYVIYSKNIKILFTLLKQFENKIIKIGLLLRELWPLQ